MMHDKAAEYIGINAERKRGLMNYYNENCARFVKPSRRYHIKDGDNWCAMFTSVIANMYGLSPDQFPYEVSVGEQVKLARQMGIYTANMEMAKPDDLIIFDWQGVNGWPDHVGFIKEIKNGVITTIEGNYKDTVGGRIIALNSKFINGVIRL